MNFKIFIVEDNKEIVSLLKKALFSWGFSVESCSDFNHVKNEINDYSPHLVLMDINLPYYNGFFWTQKIRQTSQIPIIFLSSRAEDSDMIMAMNFGADDYITKPFNIELLIVKINALLRREYSFTADRNIISFQRFTLNVVADELISDDQLVVLSKNETKLLHLLFLQPNKLVNKEEIMASLWDNETFIDRNTLAVTLTRLRKKTTEIGLAPHLITVKGRGIKLND
ncbi:response regulator transcription factor [Leuconostoc carnosum]|uniref:response regulator transcription factor n=1 Tax=Leuconostoc carnosum TaxID=1252 RepID=UPI001238688D|nr:response regulator transcription factor [Leuconostoc carnosum]KAA8370896.1 response regulator transcription factor [Leuconostoc carnosum]KAA8382539.1 response regulator transcription factor [Leuconostoc carnosum]